MAWREELCGISGLSDRRTYDFRPKILRTIKSGTCVAVLSICKTPCAAG